MGIPVEKHRHTIAEYFAIEHGSDVRHEYQDGEVLAMSGGSPAQSFISLNIGAELRNALKGKPCRAAESNLRIGIPRLSKYLYADASIVCGPLQFDLLDEKQHTILNPRVIIEVLSPSTEAYDRGEKFAAYREIETFEEYILIAQDHPSVETWLRQPDGAWSIKTFAGLASIASIRCLNIQVAMMEIYAGVEWTSPGKS